MFKLSDTDLQRLFSGAPQYFARSEGPNTGAPNPSVAFPWDETLEIRDLTDHAQIEDEAWGGITALPHITRSARRQHRRQQDQAGAGPSASPTETKKRAHFYPKCRERPNMLSMQGLEKGSVGYSGALELAVADSLQEEQFGFDSLGRKATAVVEARQKILTSKDPGLRHLEEGTIMEQLIKNGSRYLDNKIRDDNLSTDLYNELFLHILHPPTRVLDHNDPYSLSVQIRALVKVLAAPNVWVDFSRVEWRIRLGQVLWGTTAEGSQEGRQERKRTEQQEDEVNDGVSIRPAESAEARHEERYWLLLQILLACELWIRLDAITEADEAGTEHITPREVYRFQQDATPAVKWSMLLARCWLENVEVGKNEPVSTASLGAQHHQHHESGHGQGWLATLTKRLSGSADNRHDNSSGAHSPSASKIRTDAVQPAVYSMRGRHGQRQVEGLTHFARRLRWPDIEAHEARLAEAVLRAATEHTPLSTPLGSPLSADWSSYFAHRPTSPTTLATSTNSDTLRIRTSQPPTRRKLAADLHPGGWLSKSYVSGLMLPGEGMNHFLMAALLETDSVAMRRLGPTANLSGGFVYGGKSFWSTACVVGRVISAGKGAVECMGWISSDVVPEAMGDGWLNIEVQEVPADMMRTGKQARLWGKLAIERESAVLGNGDPDAVSAADFIIPHENVYSKDAVPPNCHVELRALKLFAPVDSVHTTPTESKAPQSALSELDASVNAATPTATATAPDTATRQAPEIHTYPAAVTFSVIKYKDEPGLDGEEYAIMEEESCTFCLSSDVHFTTAHPCVPSQHVRVFKSPESPTIREVDSSHPSTASNPLNSVPITCHPLHKYYDYTAMHLTELLARRDESLEDLISSSSYSTNQGGNAPGSTTSPKVQSPASPTKTDHGYLPHSRHSSTGSNKSKSGVGSSRRAPRVLVIDCISGFQPLPQEHEIPLSPVVSRSSSYNFEATTVPQISIPESSNAGPNHEHSETRRRQFGSDMEILVRALCAEKGWNALLSRRRRGCVACAIREAGALGWKVIIRVD